MARAPIGRLRRVSDAGARDEIDRLYALLQTYKVGGDSLDVNSACSAIGKGMRDGQLEVLNRAMDGRTTASFFKSTQSNIDSSDPAKTPLRVFQREDGQGGTFQKLFPGGTDTASPWTFEATDDSVFACVAIEQKGSAPGLTVEKAGLAPGSQPVLRLPAGAGFSGRFIDTSAGGTIGADGAYLSNAGLWNPSCSIRNKTDRQRPMAAWFFQALSRVRFWRWKSRKDGTRHVGPCREDFEREFHTDGMSDYDLAGAALMGVQFLLERLESLEREVKRLKDGAPASR